MSEQAIEQGNFTVRLGAVGDDDSVEVSTKRGAGVTICEDSQGKVEIHVYEGTVVLEEGADIAVIVEARQSGTTHYTMNWEEEPGGHFVQVG
jgi:hypothetical protein